MANTKSNKKATKTAKAAKAAKVEAKDNVVRLHPNLENYTIHEDVKTKCGRPAIDNDDKVANKLRGKTLDEVYKDAAKTLKVSVAELQKAYSHLNPGMQRMNLGNRLRKVLGLTASAAKQPVKKAKKAA